jgi:hypothetical protein
MFLSNSADIGKLPDDDSRASKHVGAVEWSRVSPFLQATKVVRESWGIGLLCFLDLFTSRPLSTPGKDPVPILQVAGWAPDPVWTGAENPPPQPGFDPRTVRPVASRYSNWATRPIGNKV